MYRCSPFRWGVSSHIFKAVVNKARPSTPSVSLLTAAPLHPHAGNLSSGRFFSSGNRLLTPLGTPPAANGSVETVLDLTSGGAGQDLVMEGGVSGAGSHIAESLVTAASSLGEPTFASLGLAHGYPSGMMQAILEVVHVHGGLSWWATIAATTVAMRLLLFPLVIKTRRNQVKMNHIQPEMERLQMKLSKASSQEEVTDSNDQLAALFKRHGASPFGMFGLIIAQGSIFASMFFGLRGMANLPVESMKVGGMGWFTDLTVADPIMLLPLLTCASLYANIKVGADGVNLDTMPPFFRTLITVMPFITFPVMINFPAALNVYWLSTNLMSLGQTLLLKPEAVRTHFGIGKMIQWKDEDLPVSRSGAGLFGGLGNQKGIFQDRLKKALEEQDEIRRKEMEKSRKERVKERRRRNTSKFEENVEDQNVVQGNSLNKEERERLEKLKQGQNG